MRKAESDLIYQMWSGQVQKAKVLAHFSYLGVEPREIATTVLLREILAKDAGGIEFSFTLANTFGYSAPTWVPILRGIALEDWHFQQETIALTLGEYRMPEDVPLLLKLAFAKFEHTELEGDDPLLLKCMEALGKFDCQEALDALEIIAKVDNVDVAERIHWFLDRVRNRIELKAASQKSG